jgi:hypothetical protein
LTAILETQTQYSVRGQLEYRRGVEDRKGSDHATFSIRYAGPYASGFYRGSASSTLGATWSHVITDRLASVVNITGVRLPRTQKVTNYAPTTRSYEFYRSVGLKVIASLTYSLRSPQSR